MAVFKHTNSQLFFWNKVFGLPENLGETYTLAYLGSRNFNVLAESWDKDDGVYLFLNTAERELEKDQFIARLKDYLSQELNQNVRFLWIKNPVEPVPNWFTAQLSVDNSKQFISQLSYVELSNYTFAISRNCSIRLNTAKDGFLISRGDNPEGFELSTEYGRHRMYSFTGDLNLPMQGDHTGCLQINFSVPKKETTSAYGYPDLPHLDMGMRVFMRDPEFPDARSVFDVNAHRYPLFDERGDHQFGSKYSPTNIDFGLSLDPLNPLNPDRSCFTILPGDRRLQQLGIPSGYRSNLGYIVHLIPQTTSKLVFAERPVESKASAHQHLYLVPSGEFEMKVPRYTEDGTIGTMDFEDNVVCGISGLEYIKLTPRFQDIIVFKPGYPAFAPAYASIAAALRLVSSLADTSSLLSKLKQEVFTGALQLDQELEAAFPKLDSDPQVQKIQVRKWLELAFSQMNYGGQDDSLTSLATTAYAYIRQKGGANAVYYAQPDQAVLHKPGDTADFFEYMEVPALGLPDNLSDEKILAFPLLPYAQVDGEVLNDLRVMEEKIIAKVRAARILEIGKKDKFQTTLLPNNTRAVALTGTSPQGLLATFSPDFKTWDRLVLAKGTNGIEIALTKIPHGASLKNALQTNPLFLVVSKAEELSPFFTEHQLEIKGWTFDLNPQNWVKQGTILIFKFQEKPLIDLARDIEYWTQATSLNDNASKTSNKIVAILQNAIQAASGDDEQAKKKYAALARIAKADAWTGIIALNANVPLGGLPDDLKALAGGIDANNFYAQYLGVEITPVELTTSNSLSTKQSSLYGLIDYKNDHIPLADSSGYNFHVASLTIIFNNSGIADFAAQILVLVDGLFGERTQLLDSPGGRNIISLQGTAERHGNKINYAFGFSGKNCFILPHSEAMDEVEIVKVTFATHPIPDLKADPLLIKGSFFFWARLRFALKEEFDVLSFGTESAQQEEKADYLSVSNLQLFMSFSLVQTTNQVVGKTFELVEDKLNFDLNRSGFRKQSLYEKFPLKLVSLNVVKNNATALEQSGYMPVKSPLSGGKLGDSWYGLVFDLNMGSLGALAGKAGLVASILVAWSPSSDQTASGIYVGLKLPGSTGGKKEIVIQGILKIVFKQIEFVVYPTGKPAEIGYLLKLKNIMLKFFVLSLPPSGQSELILFGDPREDVERKDKLVGWYAGYGKK